MIGYKPYSKNDISVYTNTALKTLCQGKKIFFIAFLLFLFHADFYGQTINVDDISPAPVCAGSAITVTFTSSGFSGSNAYIAYLSQADGTFSTPLNSNTVSFDDSKTSTINLSIPPNATTSSSYLVKVFSGSTSGNSIAFTINALPAAPIGIPGSRCGTGAVIISATPGDGETIDWYDTPTGGTLLETGNTSYTTPGIAATTVYYAEARNTSSGCVSITRTPVIATVHALPTPSIMGSALVCINSTGNVYATQSGNSNYAWAINGGTITSGGGAANNTATVTWTSGGNQSINVNYTDVNGCTASAATVYNVTVNLPPTIADAGPDRTDASTCGLTTLTLAGNTPIVGTGSWSIVSGSGGSFGNASSPTSTFSGTAGSTYTLRWTISNPPCIATTDDVVITFNTVPVITLNPADHFTCKDVVVNFTANANGTPTPTVQWYVNGNPHLKSLGYAIFLTLKIF